MHSLKSDINRSLDQLEQAIGSGLILWELWGTDLDPHALKDALELSQDITMKLIAQLQALDAGNNEKVMVADDDQPPAIGSNGCDDCPPDWPHLSQEHLPSDITRFPKAWKGYR